MIQPLVDSPNWYLMRMSHHNYLWRFKRLPSHEKQDEAQQLFPVDKSDSSVRGKQAYFLQEVYIYMLKIPILKFEEFILSQAGNTELFSLGSEEVALTLLNTDLIGGTFKSIPGKLRSLSRSLYVSFSLLTAVILPLFPHLLDKYFFLSTQDRQRYWGQGRGSESYIQEQI